MPMPAHQILRQSLHGTSAAASAKNAKSRPSQANFHLPRHRASFLLPGSSPPYLYPIVTPVLHLPPLLANLYSWPVNRLKTTPAPALVSNISGTYNRHCGRGERTLQLDDHLKNLLRELGHAINDTVSESDRITGAIAGVRSHGYDIVLKLDANIGLAKRDGTTAEDAKLTTQDRRFLESLGIQVDQESLTEDGDK